MWLTSTAAKAELLKSIHSTNVTLSRRPYLRALSLSYVSVNACLRPSRHLPLSPSLVRNLIHRASTLSPGLSRSSVPGCRPLLYDTSPGRFMTPLDPPAFHAPCNTRVPFISQLALRLDYLLFHWRIPRRLFPSNPTISRSAIRSPAQQLSTTLVHRSFYYHSYREL
jgi:hypothetical protein